MLPWTFTGQPSTHWPRAIVGTNFAADPRRIIIHQFEGVLEVRLGDTLDRKLTGEFFVVGRPEALQPDVTAFDPPSRDGQRVSPEGLWLPPEATWAPLADEVAPEPVSEPLARRRYSLNELLEGAEHLPALYVDIDGTL
jgi:hypothetical protein